MPPTGPTAVARIRPAGGDWGEYSASFNSGTGEFSYTPNPEHLPEAGRYEMRFRLKDGTDPTITVPTGTPRTIEVLEG